MKEWKPIVGYEGIYEVSDSGDVRSLDRTVISGNRGGTGPRKLSGKLMKPRLCHGYFQVKLSTKGKCQFLLVHRLVLEAFVGPSDALQCNHRDGCKTNNSVGNLEWVTPKENMVHAKKAGLLRFLRGFDRHNTKLSDEEVRVIRYWWSLGNMTQARIARYFNIDQSYVSHLVAGRYR